MSPAKRFDMQQILNYRAELEKLRKQEFAAAKHDLDKACDRLELERQEAEELAKEFSDRQQKIDSVFEMQLYADFFARKRDELKEQQRRIEALDHVLESRREDLLHATKEKKVMERLKEKQELAFRKEQTHKESLLLDEIAIQKKGQE